MVITPSILVQIEKFLGHSSFLHSSRIQYRQSLAKPVPQLSYESSFNGHVLNKEAHEAKDDKDAKKASLFNTSITGVYKSAKVHPDLIFPLKSFNFKIGGLLRES